MKRFLRDGSLKADVRDCHPASRPQHPEDLSIDTDLVRAEVDHAIRDHDIRPPIFDGQASIRPSRNSTLSSLSPSVELAGPQQSPHTC